MDQCLQACLQGHEQACLLPGPWWQKSPYTAAEQEWSWVTVLFQDQQSDPGQQAYLWEYRRMCLPLGPCMGRTAPELWLDPSHRATSGSAISRTASWWATDGHFSFQIPGRAGPLPDCGRKDLRFQGHFKSSVRLKSVGLVWGHIWKYFPPNLWVGRTGSNMGWSWVMSHFRVYSQDQGW